MSGYNSDDDLLDNLDNESNGEPTDSDTSDSSDAASEAGSIGADSLLGIPLESVVLHLAASPADSVLESPVAGGLHFVVPTAMANFFFHHDMLANTLANINVEAANAAATLAWNEFLLSMSTASSIYTNLFQTQGQFLGILEGCGPNFRTDYYTRFDERRSGPGYPRQEQTDVPSYHERQLSLYNNCTTLALRNAHNNCTDIVEYTPRYANSDVLQAIRLIMELARIIQIMQMEANLTLITEIESLRTAMNASRRMGVHFTDVLYPVRAQYSTAFERMHFGANHGGNGGYVSEVDEDADSDLESVY